MRKKENNKLKILVIFITLFYFSLLFSLASCNKEKDNYTRLRIIASSNSEEDTLDKISIKNVLKIGFDEDKLCYDSLTPDDLSNYLKENIDLNLFEKIKISKQKMYYEAKSYKGKFIPSGTYDSIIIRIDKAEGKNFWTILYPEYFGFEFEENNEIEYRSYIWDFFNKKQDNR